MDLVIVLKDGKKVSVTVEFSKNQPTNILLKDFDTKEEIDIEELEADDYNMLSDTIIDEQADVEVIYIKKDSSNPKYNN